jgi:hypothetical protein
LNINPLDEGNVYFGSTSGVTIDLANNRVGIGTLTPTQKLDVSGTSIFRDTVNMLTGTTILWQDESGIFPTSVNNRIRWWLNNDAAEIYAHQRTSDALDLTFRLTDNNTIDSFVFWVDDFRGESDDSYPLQMDGQKAVFNALRRYATSATTSGAGNVDFYVLKQNATGLTDSLIFGDVSASAVGINTSSPSETLDIVGRARVDRGMYSFSGINTGAGTYTNQWQKVCSFGNPANLFDYATFVMRVDVGGSTDHSNTSADVYISYKQQSSDWYVYANIINYGKTPLDVSDFEILLDSATETVTVYHKIVKNYSNPVYTYLGNSPAGLVNYGTIIGTSLSGETNDSWTQKYITNGFTSNVANGYVGIGISSPSAKLHINNTTTEATFLAEDSTNPDSTPFVIDSNGNVGIGLTNPVYKLDVSGDTNFKGDVLVSGNLTYNGNLFVTGATIVQSGLTVSGGLVLVSQPTSGYTTTQILMRNSTTGQVEITDRTSPSIYNYGMTYVMSTFNYLT